MSGKVVIRKNQKIDKFFENIKFLNNNSIKIGILAGSIGREGQDLNKVATIHEYGEPSKNIPQRSFLNKTINKKGKDIEKQFEASLKNFGTTTNGGKKILDVVGFYSRSRVIECFETSGFNEWTPLKETTIKNRIAKGKNTNIIKTLIDNGDLMNSIDTEVSLKSK